MSIFRSGNNDQFTQNKTMLVNSQTEPPEWTLDGLDVDKYNQPGADICLSVSVPPGGNN